MSTVDGVDLLNSGEITNIDEGCTAKSVVWFGFTYLSIYLFSFNGQFRDLKGRVAYM